MTSRMTCKCSRIQHIIRTYVTQAPADARPAGVAVVAQMALLKDFFVAPAALGVLARPGSCRATRLSGSTAWRNCKGVLQQCTCSSSVAVSDLTLTAVENGRPEFPKPRWCCKASKACFPRLHLRDSRYGLRRSAELSQQDSTRCHGRKADKQKADKQTNYLEQKSLRFDCVRATMPALCKCRLLLNDGLSCSCERHLMHTIDRLAKSFRKDEFRSIYHNKTRTFHAVLKSK